MARRIGAVGRAEDGSDVRMFFDSLASLVRCAISVPGIGGEPQIIEIGLDELLGQYADEINENTASLAQIFAFHMDGETMYSLVSYGYFTETQQAPATAESMMMSVTTAAKIIMETVAANMALQIHGETLGFANINGEALELSAVNGGDFSIERIFSNPAKYAPSYYSQSFAPNKTPSAGDTLVLFDGYFAFDENETLQQIA